MTSDGKSHLCIAYLDPHIFIALQVLHKRRDRVPRNAVRVKNLIDLLFLGFRCFAYFPALPHLLNLVMFAIGHGGKPSTKAHADASCEKLGKAAHDDQMR